MHAAIVYNEHVQSGHEGATMGDSNTGALRIAMVDNDERSLDALRELVETAAAGWRVVWMCSNEQEAIGRCLADDRNVDLLLLDMSLEHVQGPSVCRRIRERTWRIPIVAMTSFSLHRYRDKVVRAGAQGLVSKNDERAIVQVIAEVGARRALDGFESAPAAYARVSNERRHQHMLTLREEEIINLAADDGLADREIAEELGIAEATVRRHMHNIIGKLGARTSRQAVAMWLTPNDMW